MPLKKKIQDMKSEGTTDPAIVGKLKQEGHSNKDIYQGMEDSEMQSATGVQPPENLDFNAPPTQQPTEQKQPDYMAQPEQFEAPSPSFQQPAQQPQLGQPSQIPPQRQNIEQIEEIAEEIINEKWDELMADVGDINIWKEKTSEEIEAIKQEIIRLRNSFENLQLGVVGKVNEYNKNIGGISAEMKALNQVFQKIIEPLTSNVKELGRITQTIKKR